MRFSMNDMLYSFSYALDCVEHSLIGVTTYHGLRVAAIAVRMGKALGLSDNALLDLAACAVLHDNALTEYLHEEYQTGQDVRKNPHNIQLGEHCRLGEQNIKAFPFQTDVSGYILYHHELPDGGGPLHVKSKETPLGAQLIHIADQADVCWNFNGFTADSYPSLQDYLYKSAHFPDTMASLFSRVCDNAFLCSLSGRQPLKLLQQSLPAASKDYSPAEVAGLCEVMAKIIDYKSAFTSRHSLGVAQKARQMGKYYGYDEETCSKLYFAGALHDIGKLIVDTDILEKPDKLTDSEYQDIQNHAYQTYVILSGIDGLGETVGWAAYHHERLDGSGYPFGKKGGELGKMERIMACIDVYQALTEERPYKAGMPHEQAIGGFLGLLATQGKLDGDIIADIDRAYAVGCLTG